MIYNLYALGEMFFSISKEPVKIFLLKRERKHKINLK